MSFGSDAWCQRSSPRRAPLYPRRFGSTNHQPNRGTPMGIAYFTSPSLALAFTLSLVVSTDVGTPEAKQKAGLTDQVGISENGTCSTFWTPHIHHDDTSFDEVSFNSISTCHNVAICVTGNNYNISGTSSWSIYEVTSSGSSVFKKGPWPMDFMHLHPA